MHTLRIKESRKRLEGLGPGARVRLQGCLLIHRWAGVPEIDLHGITSQNALTSGHDVNSALYAVPALSYPIHPMVCRTPDLAVSFLNGHAVYMYVLCLSRQIEAHLLPLPISVVESHVTNFLAFMVCVSPLYCNI